MSASSMPWVLSQVNRKWRSACGADRGGDARSLGVPGEDLADAAVVPSPTVLRTRETVVRSALAL